MESIRIGDLNDSIYNAIDKFRSQESLTDLKSSQSFNYGRVGDYILSFHKVLTDAGLTPEDMIAICAPNSAQWAIAFLSTVAFGAVSVPILYDFTPVDIQKLVVHSGAKILFTTRQVFEKLDVKEMPDIKLVYETGNDFARLYSVDELIDKVPDFIKENLHADAKVLRKLLRPFPGDKTVLINYTSGSTGNPKGVMLSRSALISNLQFAIDYMPYLRSGDGILSMLPMAHMYGMLVEMIFPFAVGAHIFFLGRTPSPQVLLTAFSKVKPKLIITVPLVIEKIIFTRVFPQLQKGPLAFLYKIPVIKKIIQKKLRSGLIDVFGGELHEMIIGGSGLNPEVEKFLTSIKFPFTVGYGMTECAPLISYAPWNDRTIGSCGRVVDRMEARIDSPDPYRIPGELLVRGSNVMQGYYRNEDATRQILDKEGWMRTGDIVEMDKKGLLHIKGRSKTMILGSSGQNIYPEEIEAKLNRKPYVAESLVVSRDGRLIALIFPDMEAAEKNGIDEKSLTALMNSNIGELNSELPAYSKIANYELLSSPFEKTPKHSIKRFLYT